MAAPARAGGLGALHRRSMSDGMARNTSSTNLLDEGRGSPDVTAANEPEEIRPTEFSPRIKSIHSVAPPAFSNAAAVLKAAAPEGSQSPSPEGSFEKKDANVLICWEATGNQLDPVSSQIGLFFKLARGRDLTRDGAACDEPHLTEFKIGFDGCSVTHGIRGLCCAVGLSTQCEIVVQRCQELLKHFRSIKLTALGASRGGVAGLMLTRALEAAEITNVSCRLCLIDPVPGNLVWLNRLLSFGPLARLLSLGPLRQLSATTTSRCLEVSESKCLEDVLALYPTEALIDAACHAPVLPNYPDGCSVEEDAIPGLHTDAILTTELSTRVDRLVAYARIRRYLLSNGITLRSLSDGGTGASPGRSGGETLDDTPVALEKLCLQLMEIEVRRRAPPSYRTAHHKHDSGCIERKRDGSVLNHFHHALRAEAAGKGDGKATPRGEALVLAIGQRQPSPMAARRGVPVAPVIQVGTEIVLDVREPDTVLNTPEPSLHAGSSRHGMLAKGGLGGLVARRNMERRELSKSFVLRVRRDVRFRHLRTLLAFAVVMGLIAGLIVLKGGRVL